MTENIDEQIEPPKTCGELMTEITRLIGNHFDCDFSEERKSLGTHIEESIHAYTKQYLEDWRSGFQGNNCLDFPMLELDGSQITARIKKSDLKKYEKLRSTKQNDIIVRKADDIVFKAEIARPILEKLLNALWKDKCDVVEVEIPFYLENKTLSPKAWRISNPNHEYIYFIAPRVGEGFDFKCFQKFQKMLLEEEVRSRQVQLDEVQREIAKFQSEIALLDAVPDQSILKTHIYEGDGE
jgi:hypothetical protein